MDIILEGISNVKVCKFGQLPASCKYQLVMVILKSVSIAVYDKVKKLTQSPNVMFEYDANTNTLLATREIDAPTAN